jgi:hydroxyacylglutathione hydrolase
VKDLMEENMPQEIKTIKLDMGFKLGTVNCYLVKNGADFILIDTGPSNKRVELEKELENAGCKPGNLKLIVITHGDFDHTGNAAYLREKFHTKIAMHYDDLGMANQKDLHRVYMWMMEIISLNMDSMRKLFLFLDIPRVRLGS